MKAHFQKNARPRNETVSIYLSLRGKILIWVMPIAILGLLSLSTDIHCLWVISPIAPTFFLSWPVDRHKSPRP